MGRGLEQGEKVPRLAVVKPVPAGYNALKQPDGTPIKQPNGKQIYTPK